MRVVSVFVMYFSRPALKARVPFSSTWVYLSRKFQKVHGPKCLFANGSQMTKSSQGHSFRLQPCVCVCVCVCVCMCVCVHSLSTVSHSLQPHGLQSSRLLCPWNSPGKNTGVDSQEIFPSQGSNPGLLLCRRTLYHLNHQGSPPTYIYYL